MRTFGISALAVLLYLLLIDAAVETFVGHSPLRWIIVGTVAAYLALSALLWRKLSWAAKASLSLFVLFGLMAFAAWRSEGSDSPITLLQQPTSTLLSAATILGILLVGWILARLKFLPWPARGALVLLAAYGVAAFVVGIMARTPYAALLHGGSLWEKLPFWLQGAFIGAAVVLPAGLVLQLVTGVSQIRADQLRDWGAQVLALGMCAAITTSGIATARQGHVGTSESSAAAPPPPPSVAAALSLPDLSLPGSDAAQAFEGARRLMEKVPAETYDVAAAAKLLGGDIGKNFTFVRDNFAFDPYAGCLRGAQGTLMARAGNDIDRSLLLAALLKINGHDTRLVRGTLSNADAQRLLARATQPPVPVAVPNLSVEDVAAISGLPVSDLQKLFDKAKVVAQQVGQNLEARVQYDTRFIQWKLEAAGIHLSPGAVVSSDGVRSHVWVQVQAGDAWTDLDSSFPDAKVGQHFAEPEGDPIAADSLPDDWYQTLRFRVLSLAPGASDANELLNQQLHVADLVAQVLDLVFAPQDNDDSLAANSFQPTLFAGANRYTGSSVELGPAKPGGDITGGLTGALGGGGEGEPEKGGGEPLPRILLEITLQGPGSPPERMTRIIADTSAIQDATRRMAEMRDQLLSLYQFVVAVGPMSPEWVTGQLLTFLKQFVSPDEKEQAIIPMDLFNLAMAATKDDGRGDHSRRFYARPLIVAQRVRSRHSPDGRLIFTKAIDIIHNRVEFSGGDALAAVRQGALETELERAAIPRKEVLNTAVVFERTQADIRVLAPGRSDALGKIDLNDEAKARIAEDLGSGYAVIVPSASVRIAGMPVVGWWRVRPAGGETLGRMQSGEGQSLTEYALRYGPSAYSAVGGLVCRHVLHSNTNGCNPCLLAAAGLLGSLDGVILYLSESLTAARSLWIVGTAVYGLANGIYSCSSKGIDWGQSSINH
jgi:hypothetical protein